MGRVARAGGDGTGHGSAGGWDTELSARAFGRALRIPTPDGDRAGALSDGGMRVGGDSVTCWWLTTRTMSGDALSNRLAGGGRGGEAGTRGGGGL
jgi:hypothetical protein